MSTRPSMLRRGVTVTSLLALTGLLPALTRAWQASAFDADRVSDVLMALGGSAPVESPLLRLSCPDVAENGAANSQCPKMMPRKVSGIGVRITRGSLNDPNCATTRI